LVELLKKNTACAIVYCKSRKQTQDVARLLQQHQINADYYHAGLSSIERSVKQQNWISNQCTTIVCTNAFGMGIDKPDVRLVIHYAIPESLENYYQEAGRAGRDGKDADAILLYAPHEIQDLEKLNDLRYPDANQLKKLYTDLMNYLQVPAGIGEGQSFDFDIVDFATNFKWNVLQATYGLQAIAQEGLLYFNEQNFKPSKIVFTTTKEALYDFEHNNLALEPIIKALLRSYEGIFDYPTNIHETRIAKISSTPIDLVRLKIQALHKYQVINYQPAAETPQVVLLKNRMYVDAFKFDLENLRIRKEKHAERVNQMIHYTTNESNCRSQIIGLYFNDLEIKECGKCDNCISDKKTELNDIEFEHISQKIFELLNQGEHSIQKVLLDIGSNNIEKTNEVIQYLFSEEIISMNEMGLLKTKKKGPR
jgi:ATP-dependent DNA helicase RecQ